eukprot:3923561-Amphidinium_carterae.1
MRTVLSWAAEQDVEIAEADVHNIVKFGAAAPAADQIDDVQAKAVGGGGDGRTFQTWTPERMFHRSFSVLGGRAHLHMSIASRVTLVSIH